MIRGIEALRDWFLFNNRSYWMIRRTEKGDLIARTDENQSQEPPAALVLLESIYTILEPGTYLLQCWSGDPKATTGLKTATWFIKPGDAPQLPGHINGTAAESIETIRTTLQREFEGKRAHEKAIEELHAQIKELKAKQQEESVIEKIIGRLEPYLPLILKSLSRTAPAVTGQPRQPQKPAEKQTETQEEMTESESRAQNALQKLYEKVGDDLPGLLEKLADLSENDPETFNTALKLLK